jgi:hypothetical protein
MTESNPIQNYTNWFTSPTARGDAQDIARTKNFEHERLKFLLGRLKLGNRTNELMQLYQEQTGERSLRFAAFNQLFPTFPFVLGAHTLCNLTVPWGKKNTGSDYAVHRDDQSTEPARFKKFGWVPFVLAYQEFYSSVVTDGELRRVCLIYPRKGFLHGMCIHNDQSEEFWPSGLAWVYKFNDGGRDRRLFVMPFQSLVEAIYAGGRGWKP